MHQPETHDPIVGNPVHRLFALYAAASAIAVFFPYRGSLWLPLLVVHLLVIALLWPLPPFAQGWAVIGDRFPRTLRIPFDVLPLLLVPVLYTELAVLNVMVHAGRYFDRSILSIEHAVFGMPSRELAVDYPVLWLSELLHAGYLSYYFIIFVTPMVLYFTRRTREYRRVVFTLLLSFFMHYMFFIFFPVQGPRYLFPAPGGAIANGQLYRLTHYLLEAGSTAALHFRHRTSVYR